MLSSRIAALVSDFYDEAAKSLPVRLAAEPGGDGGFELLFKVARDANIKVHDDSRYGDVLKGNRNGCDKRDSTI